MEYRDFLIRETTKIYNSLSNKNNFYLVNHPSLLGGKSGISLFMFHYDRIMKHKVACEIGEQYLRELVNAGDQIEDFTMGNGLLGVAWLFQHLRQGKFIDYSLDQKEIDDLSLIIVNKYHSRKNYDAFYGMIGVGNFYLDQKAISDIGIQTIRKIVDNLIDLSVKNDRGTYWDNYFSVTREDPSHAAQDLGLAHGIPSIIVFLTRVQTLEIYPEDLNPIIESACLWMISKEGSFGNGKFPHKLINGEVMGSRSRVAWCFGDLGIGISLMNAYEVTKNEIIGKKAIETLVGCSERTLENSEVNFYPEANYIDGGLCHGAVGNAFIFWKLWKKYSNPKFKQAFEYWLNLTIKHSNDRPLGGYIKFVYETEYPFWQGIAGLMDGSAGIGMCFLTILADNENNGWDSIFSLN